jgi:hypothetical protein
MSDPARKQFGVTAVVLFALSLAASPRDVDGTRVRLVVDRPALGDVLAPGLNGLGSSERTTLSNEKSDYTMNSLPAYSQEEAPEAVRLARTLLDDSRPRPEREAVIRDHPAISSGLVAAMVADLTPGTPEEYRRIPWIWRVAVAAGKRNDEAELLRLLDTALPQPGAALDDWRAVVIGGGLINGVSQAGDWPAERFEQILKDRNALAARWRRALELAAPMADDAKVPPGTRYDALRMLGAEPWDRSGARLFRYLLRGVHAELQMGAISGLNDVRSPAVAQALLSGLDHYSERNRALSLDALLRDEDRATALLDALAGGRVSRSDLGATRIEALTGHKSERVRLRAVELLAK